MIGAPETSERREERRFARSVLLFIILGFAAVALAGITSVAVMVQGEEQTGLVNHTHEVERGVSGIRLALEEMRSARRGFVLGLAGDSGATYPEASRRLFDGIARVGRLTIDNPVQQNRVVRLSAMAGTLDGLFKASMGSSAQRVAISERERQQLAGKVEALAMQMLVEERRLLVARDASRIALGRTFYAVLALTALLLIAVAIGSIWVIRRYTGELLASRDQMRALNQNLEGAVAERTTDLQRANDEIQRFAYIVSHDLRSPLVNVMGFTAELDAAIEPLDLMIGRVEAEAPALVDEEVRRAVREDLPEAIGFIRGSTQKMDRLINAILTLSRQGRRTITIEPIALDQLASSVVDGLRHQIDEHGIAVTIAPDMPKVVSDRLSIEQILSNLVENAVKYMKPGRAGEISIAARQLNGRVLVDVADNGRGIDRRDHERVFDLFRRSGVQDRPGEGIGLAHVRALAYRLGGTITVDSDLDVGATFTLNLPAEFAGEKAALT
ncbi:hypothetical protein WP12_16465 [Sphingomonas sp. SRS2]|nr:hypothetical protein WP12_16465 [Sphingomonas sp. SRS2]